ncbi:MAG: T9SS type A sorting domain-containing protein, partial [bacterium]
NQDFSIAELQLRGYPNPAYDKLTIQYTLPHRTVVNLSLYDVSGRLIDILVNEVQNSGIYLKKLKTTHFPQGIYFVRLNIDGACQMDKIILLR